MARKRMSPEDRLAARLARQVIRAEEANWRHNWIWDSGNPITRPIRFAIMAHTRKQTRIKPALKLRLRETQRQHRKGRRHGR